MEGTRPGRAGLGRSHRPTLLLLGALALYFSFHHFVLPGSIGNPALRDAGFVSIFTMALLAANLVLISREALRASSPGTRLALSALAYAALIYLLREADFHRLFTDEHVTRGRFYTDSSIALGQRLAGGAVMGAFLVCVAGLLARYAASAVRACLAREPWAIAFALWAVSLVGSQVADKLLRRHALGALVEEGLEASAACLALLAVCHARRSPESVGRHLGSRPAAGDG